MSETPSRPMKFPYTFSAKVAQFPYKFHFQYNWMVRYWVAGVILSIPVFYKIHKLSNSPENVRNFEEAKRKEEAARHHH